MVAMNSFVPPIMKNDSFFTTSVTVAMVTQTYLIASRSAPRSLRVVCLMSSKLFSSFSQFCNKQTNPRKALKQYSGPAIPSFSGMQTQLVPLVSP